MAKNKGQKRSNAEDYLAQVEWQNRQLQGQPDTPLLPWYLVPKWKFKRVYSFKNVSVKKFFTLVIILLTLTALYIGYSLYKNDIIILIVLASMGIFLFFTICDAPKNPKEDKRKGTGKS